MTPANMRFAAFGLMVLALTAPCMTFPAFAAETHGAAARPATPVMRLTPDEVNRLEAMSAEERLEFFKQRREEFAALSPEDQQRRREERKAAFESLPADQQESVRERTQKILDDLYNPAPRDEKAEAAEAQKEVNAYVNSLTPDQKAQWDEIRKNSKKWEKKKAAAPKPAPEDDGQ